MSDPDPRSSGGATALLVIDMQNAYFELPGLSERREAVLARVNELLQAARAARRPVVLVRTEHARDRSTWTLNMIEDDEGFAYPGTEQAQFLSGLDVEDYVEIVKTRDSAFHGTPLREELARLGVAHLLICGVSTHSCVAQTAIDAFAHDLHAAVACGAATSENPDLADALLEFLHTEMRQPLLNQADSLALLRDGWPPPGRR